MMTQNTIQDLRDERTALQLQLSQQAQTANIVSQVRPIASPSYIVQNPYCGC